MLRISKLIRPVRNLRKVPVRAGLPGWDRPDPPPSAKVPTDHELTDQQILFFFPDRNMPEFFLTEPEIYEGDSFREGGLNFLTNWAIYLIAAGIIGGTLYITIPTRQDRFYAGQFIKKAKQRIEFAEKKTMLEWAKQNPMGLEVSADFYPQYGQLKPNKYIVKARDSYERVTQPNAQIKSYLTKLKQKCEEKTKNSHHTEQTHHQNHH